MITKTFKSAVMLIALAAFLFSNFIFIGTVCAQDITSDLMTHYKFNGNGNDETPNAFHLTNSGAILTADRFGNANSAYSFNGSSYLSVENISDGDFSNSVITISEWVKITANATADYRVVAIGKKNTYFQFLVQGILSDTAKTFWIETNGISSYNFYHVDNDPLTTGVWHQVTCVADAGMDSSYIYVDGLLKTVLHISVSDLNLNNGTETIMIGASVGSGDYFKGSMDDVRIYNRAMTAADVAELYSHDTTTAPPSGISKTKAAPKFSVYPNPANDQVTIQSSFDVSGPYYEINDAAGRLVLSGRLHKAITHIDISGLSQGFYFLQIPGMEQTAVKLLKR